MFLLDTKKIAVHYMSFVEYLTGMNMITNFAVLRKGEPMSDLIERQAVIDLCESKDPDYKVIHFKEDVECLPSVSTEKTGHWIMPQQDDGMSDPIYYQVRCSKCGFDLDPLTWHMELHQYGADKYCPKCGRKMYEDKGVLEQLSEKQNNLSDTNKAWSDAIEKNGYVN